jgi:hypothetical protein
VPQPIPVVEPRRWSRQNITPITVEWREIIERMQEAKRQFRNVLSEFPANSVAAQVVGKPKPIKITDDGKVTLRIQVRLKADDERMMRFLKQVLLSLEQFQEYHWEENWLFAPENKTGFEYARTGIQGESKTVTLCTSTRKETRRGQA